MVASIGRAVHLPINPVRKKRGSSFSPLGFSPSGENSSPTKNILREALYYQVFDRFEPPVNPPCSASRSTAVFHSSWCRPSRGGIVSARNFPTRFVLFAITSQKTGAETLDSRVSQNQRMASRLSSSRVHTL